MPDTVLPTSAACIVRHPSNPVLCDRDVPYPAGLVFNAGVCKYRGRYVMVFRNDVCDRTRMSHPHETNLGLAFSDDGVTWAVEPEPCYVLRSDEVQRAYDPRLTVIDDRVVMCFAVDTNHGVRGGIAVTEDFRRFEVMSLTAPDNRNMVVFPHKIGGRYARLERPMPVYSRYGERYHRFDAWYSDSPDLRYWGNTNLVLGAERIPGCNDKVGPGAPPILTERGWLATYHAVDRDDDARGKNGWEARWTKRYWCGVMLLDRDEPWRVIGYSRDPLIFPEAPYETEGFRGDVVFPGGMILEDDGAVKIYYGGADTVECLATAHVDNLLALCTPA